VVIWVNSAAELRCVQWGFVAEGIGQRRVREKRQLAGTRMESKKKKFKMAFTNSMAGCSDGVGGRDKAKKRQENKKKNGTKMGKMARNEKKSDD
jgi:hypothetical protein